MNPISTQELPARFAETVLVTSLSPVDGAGTLCPGLAALVSGQVSASDERRHQAAKTRAPTELKRRQLAGSWLRTVRSLLTGELAGDEYVTALESRHRQYAGAFDAGLAAVRKAQVPTRKAWAEVVAVHELSRGQPFELMNHDPARLVRDRTQRDEFFARLPRRTALRQNDMVSLLVLLAPVYNEAALRVLGEAAVERRMQVVTSLPDVSLAEAREMFGRDGDLRDLRGKEEWRKTIVLAGNHVQLFDDVWISPAALLAGQMMRNDRAANSSMAVTPAGWNQALQLSFADRFDLRWQLDHTDALEAFQHLIVPIVDFGTRRAFWGAWNLANHQTEKIFASYRVKMYVERCLVDYLNKRCFENIGETEVDEIREALGAFLRELTGPERHRLLDLSLVRDIAPSESRGAELFRLRLKLRFKIPTTTWEIEVEPEMSFELQATRSDGAIDVR